jgi:hypothetical protein
MNTRFVRRPEAARLIGCSKRSLEDWSIEGSGPPEYRPAGKRLVLYDVQELELWVRGGGPRSTSQEPEAEVAS